MHKAEFDANEVLGPPSGWIVNSGISTVFLFIIILLAGAAVLPYNQKIQGDFVLKTSPDLLAIEAQKSGKVLKTFSTEGEIVMTGDTLLIIAEKEYWNSILAISNWVEKHDPAKVSENTYNNIPVLDYPTNIQLLVSELFTVKNEISELSGFKNIDATIQSIDREIDNTNQLVAAIEKQSEILENEINIRKNIHLRNESLNNEGIISDNDFETSTLLNFAANQQQETLKSRVYENMIRIEQLLQKKRALTTSYQEDNNSLTRRYSETFKLLKTEIKSAIRQSVVISDSNGKWIWASKSLRKDDFVTVSSPIGFVVPDNEKLEIIAEITCPQANSADIKIGTTVLLDLSAYPESQYGWIEEKVTSILPSINPVDLKPGSKRVDAILNKPIETTAGFTVPFEYNLAGKASFIIEQKTILNWMITNILNLN